MPLLWAMNFCDSLDWLIGDFDPLFELTER